MDNLTFRLYGNVKNGTKKTTLRDRKTLKKHKEAGKKNDNYLTSKEYVLMTIAYLRKVNSIM